jgi:hypothetical protein
MNTVASLNKETFSIEMLRDDFKVIERRGASPAVAKKAFAKLHGILRKMPENKANTLAELKKTRDSRGRT